MTVTVDQQRLVLNAFAALFENNLVSTDLVTWNKFDSEMNDRNGLEVVEQVTPDYTTNWTTDGVADLSGGVQDTVFGSERYRLRKTINSSMGWGDFVKIRDIGSARESQALRKAALRLATDVDAYIMNFAANASNNWVGNANGTDTVADWDDVATAYTRLKEQGVDTDGNLRAVLTYADKQALGSAVVSDNASLTDIGAGIYRNGWEGSVAGVPTLFTQQLGAFTTGTRTNGATNYATGTPVNDYKDVAISPIVGGYKSGLINIDGVGATGTVKDGEVFTIAGVYAYDPRARKQLAHLQQFRVIGDYTAASGAIANMRYFPAIITTGPHQTVVQTNSSWNDLVVTFKGAAGVATMPRFIADKSAIIVHTADLIMPATGTARRQALTKIPLSVRMWQDSVFATGEHRIRFDVAIEANVAADARERLVRLNGA